MKSSKGFTLVEILTALMAHAFFILMLGGTFYALLSFGNKSQQVLIAREHGRRVIDYVDSRIRNAGLGMWKLESYDAVINALEPLTKAGKPLNNTTKKLRLPVAVTYDYQDSFSNSTLAQADTKTKKDITKKNEDERLIIGNILTLLYAERESTDNDEVPILIVEQNITVNYTDEVLNKLINQLTDDNFWKEFFKNKWVFLPEQKELTYVYDSYKDAGNSVTDAARETINTPNNTFSLGISATKVLEGKINAIIKEIQKTSNITDYLSKDECDIGYKFLRKYKDTKNSKGEFFYSDFGKEKNSDETVESDSIKAWGVTLGAGVPIIVQKNTSDLQKINLTPSSDDVIVPQGDELLYLRCERIFAENPRDKDKENGETVRNLKVQKLKDTAWGDVTPFESGILEIYAELHKDTNILDFYVLSTGGRDNTMKHERPKDWPYTARPVESKEGNTEAWNKSEYCNDIVYVSRASWKLNNLCEDFEWD